jgi:hypothetical protein
MKSTDLFNETGKIHNKISNYTWKRVLASNVDTISESKQNLSPVVINKEHF